MTALLLTTLFAVAALFALGVLVDSWKRYGTQALAGRDALAACPQTREVRYAVREVKVLRGAAQVYVLPVRRSALKSPVQLLAA